MQTGFMLKSNLKNGGTRWSQAGHKSTCEDTVVERPQSIQKLASVVNGLLMVKTDV